MSNRTSKVRKIRNWLALALAIVALVSVAFLWPTIYEPWFFYRLKTESAVLESAILDPTTCPPGSLERFFKTREGKSALLKLYLREAERRFATWPSRYEGSGFSRALFLVQGTKIHAVVFAKQKTIGLSKKNSDGKHLVLALNEQLQHIEGFSANLEGRETDRVTVLKAGEAAQRTGYYLRFNREGNYWFAVYLPTPLPHGELPEEIRPLDIELMNRSYALIVERK